MRLGNQNGIYFGTSDGKLWEWFTGFAAPNQIGTMPGTPKSLYHWGANAHYALSTKGAFHRISGASPNRSPTNTLLRFPYRSPEMATVKMLFVLVRFRA
ncbi:hypothetical protein G7066_12665 [Leucobacter coleopterorum]|uniref:Uncharacterized protein n=1 Tax=Leucobacter coleopterorum TaxID=2714933 RepID=A0ABX6JY14_9MICO|nr:hypothetical protein [Leucobacter coleopterorum]QIM19209.1 hypothetical protein G7066_12665 [Leucobacter coleopterorum]